MAVSVALSPIPILQFFDNAGNLAAGGSLLTQVGGVNYPTYSDNAGSVALPNPIPLNSRGEVSTAAGSSSELFLQTGTSYTFILSDINGNQLWSVGNIVASSGASLPTSSGTANAQIITNTTPISLGNGVTQWFIPVATNTGTLTVNIDNTGAIQVNANGAAAIAGMVVANVPALLIYNGTTWNLVNPQRSTSSFTATFSVGFTTTPTGTINYSIDSSGKGVDVWVPSTFTATSNTGGWQITGVPTIIQPVTAKEAAIGGLEDSGAGTMGTIRTGTSGTWVVSKLGNTAGWTTSGVKGFSGASGANMRFTLD